MEAMKLGDFECHAIIESRFRLDGGAMFGSVPKVLWERIAPADESNRIQMVARPLLVLGGDKKILIDAGLGRKFPKKARSMYVAAVLACSGLGGAIGSFSGGLILKSFDGFSASWGYLDFSKFHIVFGIGILLRWSCIPVAMLIRERESQSPGTVWFEIIGPALLRWVRYPLGFFSRRNGGGGVI